MRNLFFLNGLFAVLVVPEVGALDFKNDVYPIFKEKCAKCHMNGEEKGSVKLDLEGAEREVGFWVTKGKPVEDSPVYDVVTTSDREVQMPPPGKGTALTSREKKLVKEWIESGASIGGEMVAGVNPPAGGGEGGLPERTSGPAPLAGEWVNNKGQKITATLLRVTGETAILKIADGREVPYPITNLSEESQAKVRAFAEGGEADGGAERMERGGEREREDEKEDEDDD